MRIWPFWTKRLATVFDQSCKKSRDEGPALLPKTQQKIVAKLHQIVTELAPAFGRKALTLSEGIQLIRAQFGSGKKEAYWLHKTIAVEIVPGVSQVQNFENIDTDQKLVALLQEEPEPSPEQLREILKFLDSLVPGTRRLVLSQGKELSHGKGGRPRKLDTVEEEQEILKEIKRLLAENVTRSGIDKRLAGKYDVSPNKIKALRLKLLKSPSEDSQT